MSDMDFYITIYQFLLLFIITYHVNHVNHGFKNIDFKTVNFMPGMNELIFTFLYNSLGKSFIPTLIHPPKKLSLQTQNPLNPRSINLTFLYPNVSGNFKSKNLN